MLQPPQDNDHLYDVSMPTYKDNDITHRGMHQLWTFCPHEVVSHIYKESSTLRYRLQEATSGKELPPAYVEHPIVQKAVAAGAPLPVPLGIFIDGVPCSHIDSAVGVWVILEPTGERLLVAVLRKSICCSCGCRGWCSYRSMFSWLVWSLAALAEGRFPEARHDNKDFQQQARIDKAGQYLGCTGAVIWMKADWAEIVTTLGFPSWNDAQRPCALCNASSENFQDVTKVSPNSFRWRLNAEDDYNAACARCESCIDATEEQHR